MWSGIRAGDILHGPGQSFRPDNISSFAATLTTLSLTVQVKLAAGLELAEVQLALRRSPSAYFNFNPTIEGRCSGTSEEVGGKFSNHYCHEKNTGWRYQQAGINGS